MKAPLHGLFMQLGFLIGWQPWGSWLSYLDMVFCDKVEAAFQKSPSVIYFFSLLEQASAVTELQDKICCFLMRAISLQKEKYSWKYSSIYLWKTNHSLLTINTSLLYAYCLTYNILIEGGSTYSTLYIRIQMFASTKGWSINVESTPKANPFDEDTESNTHIS